MNDDSTYEFSTDPDRIDAARVHELVSEHTYWAKGRPREVMDAAIAGSRPYGVYRRDTGEQVAFARVVTDGVTFAWLADVIVDPALRGQGLGKRPGRGGRRRHRAARAAPYAAQRPLTRTASTSSSAGYRSMMGTSGWSSGARGSAPGRQAHDTVRRDR